MSLETQTVAALQMILAAVLSAVIGLDRERKERDAGLRTHMLVGVGACLFTSLSIAAFPSGDTARVAAQIVAGIGFLGAGTILKDGNSVRGLTTAASIWVTASVGMAVGAGAALLAICVTLIAWVILVLIKRLKPDLVTEDDG